jgi:hypothetical protein
MRRTGKLAAGVLAGTLLFTVATTAGSAGAGASVLTQAAFAVANGYGSYQPGGGSTTPAPVQFNALTLASGGTASAATLSITGQPVSGTATADDSSGVITYSPTASTSGTQSVTFQLCEAGQVGCQTGTITEIPATAVNNAFPVPLVGGYDAYAGIAYGAQAPASAAAGSAFTMAFAPAAMSLPSTLVLDGHTATLNYLAGLTYILPVPANATYVAGSATVEGGDATTTGQATVKLCTSTGGTTTCTATAPSTTFPTDTTTPYLELQLSPNIHIPGGSAVTVPTVVAQFKAGTSTGAKIQPQVTEFDAGGNVTISGIVTDYSTTLSMYPTSPSFTSGTSAPAYYSYPLATTTITAPVQPPTVTGVSPANGPEAGGTSVTITGTNLTGATAVDFGNSSASVTADSATSITATAPAVASPATVDVTVTTAGGTSAKSQADQFTYLPPAPIVTGISPASGPQAGGTSVTITGQNLENAMAVDFGNNPATVSTDTATSITATSPAGTGSVSVSVTTASGTGSATQQFTYIAPPPPPAITGIDPGTGPAGGGTSVTISGTNLADATAVDFGTTAATVSSDSSGTIVALSPPGLGSVTVTVTTAGGTASSPGPYVYTIPPGFPTVTAANPASGPTWGGTTVTVTGTSLSGAIAVDFGSQPAFFSGVTATSLTALAPAGSGTVEITVTTAAGTSVGTSAATFAYSAPAPSVSGVAPTSGPQDGGNAVTISGTNLIGTTTVDFGSRPATILGYGPTSLVAIAPPGSGTVAVTVTTPGGTSPTGTSADYTYSRPPSPVITAVSPASGPGAGGTLVTVTGTNLGDLARVSFGTRPAWFSQVSATSFVTIAPAGTGTVDIRATTAGGTSAVVSADHFAYAPAAPVVTAVAPSSGPTHGGTIVTLAGTNLAFATAVRFGKSSALVLGDTATSIRVQAPAGTGIVAITVTTPGGTSKVATVDHFTYG